MSNTIDFIDVLLTLNLDYCSNVCCVDFAKAFVFKQRRTQNPIKHAFFIDHVTVINYFGKKSMLKDV